MIDIADFSNDEKILPKGNKCDALGIFYYCLEWKLMPSYEDTNEGKLFVVEKVDMLKNAEDAKDHPNPRGNCFALFPKHKGDDAWIKMIIGRCFAPVEGIKVLAGDLLPTLYDNVDKYIFLPYEMPTRLGYLMIDPNVTDTPMPTKYVYMDRATEGEKEFFELFGTEMAKEIVPNKIEDLYKDRSMAATLHHYLTPMPFVFKEDKMNDNKKRCMSLMSPFSADTLRDRFHYLDLTFLEKNRYIQRRPELLEMVKSLQLIR